MTYPSATLFILITILLTIFFTSIFILLRLLKKKALVGNEEVKTDIKESILSFDIFAKEIKSLRDQLSIQERLATLGEVSAGIAHELRNPLTVISGNARLLLRGLKDPEQIELSEGILREVEEINKIIEELLKFAHNTNLQRKEIDIVSLIKGIVKSFPQADRIYFEQDAPFVVWGDEQLLKQALKNLINNGLDAGTKVWITIEESKINGADALDIHVSDNGKGLSDEELNKIFIPFYSTKESGVGMGLTLVQKIAIEHGGAVKVRSQLEKGSRFTLSLPVKKNNVANTGSRR